MPPRRQNKSPDRPQSLVDSLGLVGVPLVRMTVSLRLRKPLRKYRAQGTTRLGLTHGGRRSNLQKVWLDSVLSKRFGSTLQFFFFFGPIFDCPRFRVCVLGFRLRVERTKAKGPHLQNNKDMAAPWPNKDCSMTWRLRLSSFLGLL